jgi:hypothetical protein
MNVTTKMDQNVVKYRKLSLDRSMIIIVGLEDLTAVVVKNYVFWDAKPSSSLKVKRSF